MPKPSSILTQLFTVGFTAIFIFTLVSTGYPLRVEAQTQTEQTLNDDFEFLQSQSKNLSLALLRHASLESYIHYQKENADKKSIGENKVCQNCHAAPPEPKFGRDDSISDSPEIKCYTLKSHLLTMKSALERYLFLDDVSFMNKFYKLKDYISAMNSYLVVELIYSKENPFRYLDKNFSLVLPPQFLNELQDYMISEDISKEDRELFLTMVSYDNGKLSFSQDFKVSVELSSFLFKQTKESWFQFTKLTAIHYFTKQLLALSDYWPDDQIRNDHFFASLGNPFRSLEHHFDYLMDQKKRTQSLAFNIYLGDHLEKQSIPNILTLERYRQLLDYAPLRKEIIGDNFKEFFENINTTEVEESITRTHLKNALRNHEYSFHDFSNHSIALWLKKEILKIKRTYLEDYLKKSFINDRHMTPDDAVTATNLLYAQYESELSLELIQSWLTSLGNPNDSEFRASTNFQDLALNIIPTKLGMIDYFNDQIHGYLLPDFNDSLSYSIHTLRTAGYGIDYLVPLKERWQNSGMNDGHMNSVLIKTDAPSILPKENFLTPEPIEYNLGNFLTFVSSLYQDLPKEVPMIESLNTTLVPLIASHSKEELIKNHQALASHIEDLFLTPYAYQRGSKVQEEIHHEREKLKAALDGLIKVGERIQKIDLNNKKTLDDVLPETKDKVALLKSERQMVINTFRLLSVPIHYKTDQSLMDHLMGLKHQDGILSHEVLDFLSDQETYLKTFYDENISKYAFFIPDVTSALDYRAQTFIEEYYKIVSELLPQEDRQKILDDNMKIVLELRTLKTRIENSDVPMIAYDHPEYFIDAKDHVIRLKTMEYLQRIQDLRKQRKELYLDKGGKILDHWLKNYVTDLLVRQALIQQDLINRKNIDAVARSQSFDEVKEYLTNNFMIDQARAEMERYSSIVQHETRLDYSWVTQEYQKIQSDIQEEFSEDFLDYYFHHPAHGIIAGTAFIALIVCSFGTAPELLAAVYVLNLGLRTDATIGFLHHVYQTEVVLPPILARNTDIILSTATPDTEGPGDVESLNQMQEGLETQRDMIYFIEGPLLTLWYGADRNIYRSTMKVFVQRRNVTQAFKTLQVNLKSPKLLPQAEANANALIEQIHSRLGLPSTSPELCQKLIQEKLKIEAALKTLKTNTEEISKIEKLIKP